ncbi:hypothetical protein Dimus_027081 [Dionaea muscipula]
MGNHRHGNLPAFHSPTTAVEEHNSVETSSHHAIQSRKLTPSTRTETLRISHLKVQFQSDSMFKPSQASSHRRRAQNRRKVACTEGFRRWVYAKRGHSSFTGPYKFVLMSYNILGVHNASNHPDLYCNVFSKYLDWEHRKELIIQEINRYHPSILCLQEVDRFDDLDSALQKDGFSGVFKGRTGDACDGCAIFWMKERFSLLHQEHIEFRRFGLNNNVAQFCILQIRSSQSSHGPSTPESEGDISCTNLLVGNIHVLFNPRRGDIKLGQIRLFLEKAHKLAEDWGKIPIILAGDFNCVPQSALYQLMSSSKLDVLGHDCRRICGQSNMPWRAFQSQRQCFFSSRASTYKWNDEQLRLATGDEQVTTLHHDLKLCSAYSRVSGNLRTRDGLGEPLVTSYHSKFMGTVDYIWHTAELHPLRVLDTLPDYVLRKMGCFPNKQCGSDHLPLVCEFAIADDIGGESYKHKEMER